MQQLGKIPVISRPRPNRSGVVNSPKRDTVQNGPPDNCGLPARALLMHYKPMVTSGSDGQRWRNRKANEKQEKA
ncbi:hypothetical protein ZHAS_00021758 [Anopheles sinensis]|uniref:Uncharacterized protein n=1 Tax=Anopheles sinensis TaxID=74873 RepID=A0A084WTI5_ANOSI|nr:hypothetical protein ZHAS_00021758 [Anopheles sinensis]